MLNDIFQFFTVDLRKMLRQFSRTRARRRVFREIDSTIESLPRRTPGKIRILDWDLEYYDAATLRTAIKKQVLEGINDFVSPTSYPRILDCGSNIGISVLRYKQLYPNARITAFEPHPKLCNLLRRNLERNGATDVEVVEAAVWIETSWAQFEDDITDGGNLRRGNQGTQSVKVRTIPLADYLEEPIDFVKMDIEGAELEVLRNCANQLVNVNKLIVEFHHLFDKAEELGEVLNILHSAGYHVAVNSDTNRVVVGQTYSRPPGLNADQYHIVCAWR